MLTIRRSVGVAPEMNPRNLLHTGNESGKQEIHLGFETQGRCLQKSKTCISVASQKRFKHLLCCTEQYNKLTKYCTRARDKFEQLNVNLIIVTSARSPLDIVIHILRISCKWEFAFLVWLAVNIKANAKIA